MNHTPYAAIIPERIWDVYHRMRPNEAVPIHPGDSFRLHPGGHLFTVTEILSSPSKHAVELI